MTKIISESILAQMSIDPLVPTHQVARYHCLITTVTLIAPSQPHSVVEKALVAIGLVLELSFIRRGKPITLA